MDVPEGYLIMVCFMPDKNDNYAPHAAEGMYEVLEVGGGEAGLQATPTS